MTILPILIILFVLLALAYFGMEDPAVAYFELRGFGPVNPSWNRRRLLWGGFMVCAVCSIAFGITHLIQLLLFEIFPSASREPSGFVSSLSYLGAIFGAIGLGTILHEGRRHRNDFEQTVRIEACSKLITLLEAIINCRTNEQLDNLEIEVSEELERFKECLTFLKGHQIYTGGSCLPYWSGKNGEPGRRFSGERDLIIKDVLRAWTEKRKGSMGEGGDPDSRWTSGGNPDIATENGKPFLPTSLETSLEIAKHFIAGQRKNL
jgi:hypothetical protein